MHRLWNRRRDFYHRGSGEYGRRHGTSDIYLDVVQLGRVEGGIVHGDLHRPRNHNCGIRAGLGVGMDVGTRARTLFTVGGVGWERERTPGRLQHLDFCCDCSCDCWHLDKRVVRWVSCLGDRRGYRSASEYGDWIGIGRGCGYSSSCQHGRGFWDSIV